MFYYVTLANYEHAGFEVIVDKTWEELTIHASFDESCHDIKQICRDIDSGDLDWFMLRVRVMLDGHEMGSTYMGGCLYADAFEVLTDGTVEGMLGEAMKEAIANGIELKSKLVDLCLEERLTAHAD